ncbi:MULTISPECIES: AAA family ATPase [Dehalococcoides]|nr:MULTISPECIES: ATP-binding protein [Dehalococcoides]AMU87209.1 AAA famiily ATPase [Dehalococcoides mccartyi]
MEEILDEEEMLEAALDGDDWQPMSKQLHLKRQKKNQTDIDQFFSEAHRCYATVALENYYGDLLAWTVETYLKRAGWDIYCKLGYREDQPSYANIQISPETTLNLMTNGQILISRNETRLVLTLDGNCRGATLQLEAERGNQALLDDFAVQVEALAKKENFYKGKCISFGGVLRFLKPGSQSWDSIILEESVKDDIYLNSVQFLKQQDRLSRLGIPKKRGLLLAGEPGTGKTIVCKALMSGAKDITCITTDCYQLREAWYVDELYEIARELSPSIVFIEDLDLIGKSRDEYGNEAATPLSALLAALDGLETNLGVVTIATTNFLDSLDNALIRRPSRFDRVITLKRPDLSQRQEIINRLCRKIRLSPDARLYLARHSECYTPAQLQEVVFSLAIECQTKSNTQNNLLQIGPADIDKALRHIYGIKNSHLGFIQATRRKENE